VSKKAYTSAGFCQTVRHRKNGEYKKCSSYRNNPRKMDYYMLLKLGTKMALPERVASSSYTLYIKSTFYENVDLLL
jgi:hypothetical protein